MKNPPEALFGAGTRTFSHDAVPNENDESAKVIQAWNGIKKGDFSGPEPKGKDGNEIRRLFSNGDGTARVPSLNFANVDRFDKFHRPQSKGPEANVDAHG